MKKRTPKATPELRKLESDTERQVRILSGDPTLSFIIGNRSCFDGERLFVTGGAESLTGEGREEFEGTVDHELGHKEEEEIAKARKAAGVGCVTPLDLLRSKKSNREALLLNAFEDIRIERRVGERRRGSGQNLERANVLAAKKYFERAKAGQTPDFWQSIAASVIFESNGLPVAGWLPEAFAPVVDRIRAEIDAAKGAAWVENADELAKAVLRKIEEMRDEVEEAKQDAKQREQSQAGEPGAGEQGGESGGSDAGDAEGEQGEGNGSGSAGDDSDEGDSDGEGSGNGSDSDGTGANSSANGEDDPKQGEGSGKGSQGDCEGDGSDDDGEQDAGGGWGAGGSGKFDPNHEVSLEELGELLESSRDDADASDLFDYVRDDLAEKAEAENRRRGRSTYSAAPEAVAGDTWETPKTGDAATYTTLKGRVAKQISGMRSKLIAELRARAETSFEADKERGVIDSASLYGLRFGNKNVFAQRGEEITNQVAVSIVVDQSGSMDGTRIENARLAAIAVGETLDALGCDFEITGFWNDSNCRTARHFDRDGSFRFFNFKGFGESFKRVKTRLLRMKADGWNSDPEAVLGAAKRLALQSASRKILIVMSDGQPCGGENVQNYLREVVSRIAGAGIEIYGIGIQSEAVADYYNARTGSAHVVVNEIDELAVSVFKLLKGKLLRRGRRAA